MKLVGFLLLTAGWAIALAALILLPSSAMQGLFVCAALVVELLGLAVVMRGHIGSYQEQE